MNISNKTKTEIKFITRDDWEILQVNGVTVAEGRRINPIEYLLLLKRFSPDAKIQIVEIESDETDKDGDTTTYTFEEVK